MIENLQASLSPETATWLADAGSSILMAALTLWVGWWVASRARALVQHGLLNMRLDEALARFLANMARYLVLTVVVVSALGRLGIETTSVMAVLASAGLAVGLALQGSLTNFASGVMILLFKPFNLRDVITIGGVTGSVSDIGLFATEMMRPDGTKVVVPNGSITGGILENHTMQGGRRGTIDIGVDYGSDLDEVRTVLETAVAGIANVLQGEGKGIKIAFTGFGASSLDWQVHIWAHPHDYFDVMEQARVNIYNALNAADIGIPYPHVVVQGVSRQA